MIDTTNTFTLPETRALTPHCHCGEIQLGDDTIFVVKMTRMKRVDVDAWIAHSSEIRTRWTPDKPLLVMADMSEVDFAFTPYITQQGNAMMQIQAGVVKTYIGWTIKRSFLGNILQSTIQMGSGRGGTFYRVAFDNDTVYTWLIDQRDKFYAERAANS